MEEWQSGLMRQILVFEGFTPPRVRIPSSSADKSPENLWAFLSSLKEIVI